MLNTETLHQLRTSCLGTNRTLPAHCYNDERFLDLEQHKVLRQGWICLGRCDEVSDIGDYFTTDLAGEPLLVVRSDETTISVFANVCQHRAMPVARGGGNTHRFVCPYHAWTYHLDGSLKSAPLMEQQAELKDCRLPVIKSECWQGFIFASLNASAKPLADSLHDLDSLTGNYQMHRMHHIATFHEIWECNWKSLIENFMDGYHLSVVHPQSLRPLTPTNLCETLGRGDMFTSYVANYARAAPARKQHASSLTEAQKRQSRLFCLFPSMVASVSPDTLVYFSVQPKGVARVQVKWGVSVWEPDLPDEERNQRIEKWQQINAEDHEILRELQAGLRSSFYHGGVLAPANFEGCISDFHDYLIEMLDSQPA